MAFDPEGPLTGELPRVNPDDTGGPPRPHRFRPLRLSLKLAAIALVIVATSAIMAVYGWRLALNAWGQEATAIAMPLFFVTAAIPFACACFTLLALEQGLKTLLADGRRPENRS